MENKRFSLTAVIILAIFIAVYLVWDYIREESDLNVVTLSAGSGDDEDDFLFGNLTRSWIDFNALSGPGDTVALPMAEGDLIYFQNNGGSFGTYVRYGKARGKHLDFQLDTMFPVVSLNGEPYLLFIGEEPEEPGGLTDEEIQRLEAISIQADSIPEETYRLLEHIAALNQDVGLIFEGGDEESLKGIAGLFRPGWMIVPGSILDALDGGLLRSLWNLKLLYLTEGDSLNFDALGRLRHLESLILTEVQTPNAEEVHLGKLRSLRTLTIVESDMHSLAGLNLPAGLKDLYLISSGELTDIGGLKGIPGLRDLSLMGCDTLRDLSVLNELPALRWLSLPPGTTQDNFSEIITHQADLQGLELVECNGIADLSSLVQLQNLKSLALSLSEIDYGSLKQLPAIQLVVINEKHFSDSEEEIAGLKKALPNAYIVPGGGYCLGSGWLLLVLPFLVLAVLLRAKQEK